MRKFENATFEQIKPIVLEFDQLSHLIRTNSRTIGLIRPKVAFANFRDFPNVESVEKMSNFETATFERIKRIVLGFVPLSHPIRTNPRTIGLIRSKVAFSNFGVFSTDSAVVSTLEKKKQKF